MQYVTSALGMGQGKSNAYTQKTHNTKVKWTDEARNYMTIFFEILRIVTTKLSVSMSPYTPLSCLNIIRRIWALIQTQRTPNSFSISVYFVLHKTVVLSSTPLVLAWMALPNKFKRLDRISYLQTGFELLKASLSLVKVIFEGQIPDDFLRFFYPDIIDSETTDGGLTPNVIGKTLRTSSARSKV